MIRTRIKQKTLKLPSGLMGGHMPDPPGDCIAPRADRHSGDGKLYVDNIFCRTCKKEKICQRRKEFVQEWKAYRAWLKGEER